MMIDRRGAVALTLLAFIATSGQAKESKGSAPKPIASEAALAQVLDRFDQVQSQIRTLSAEFVQTTRSPLLKDPIIAKGRFYLTKPDSVLWEYSAPEPMRFVLSKGEYTGYFPERKRAERRDVKRWNDQLFRFFGVGQGSKELNKFYEIALGPSGTGRKGDYLLVLTPKKRRVRRNVEEVRLWVDQSSMLPVELEYVGKDGNQREIRFVNTRLNPDLAASLYTVEIPEGVPVSNGFSGLDVSVRTH